MRVFKKNLAAPVNGLKLGAEIRKKMGGGKYVLQFFETTAPAYYNNIYIL